MVFLWTIALASAQTAIPAGTTSYTISTPGAYVLTGNRTFGGVGNAIYIDADNVTLDLNGFEVRATASGGSAIWGAVGRRDITVKNGFVRAIGGCIDLEGGGTYRVENVVVRQCDHGIELTQQTDNWLTAYVIGNTVSEVGSDATDECIEATASAAYVEHNTVRDCGIGIRVQRSDGAIVRDNLVQDVYNGGDGIVVVLGADGGSVQITDNVVTLGGGPLGGDGIEVTTDAASASNATTGTATIARNTVHGFAGNGIFCNFVNHCAVIENNASKNGLAGIRLDQSQWGMVERNLAEENAYGIRVTGPGYAVLTGNRAVANTTDDFDPNPSGFTDGGGNLWP